MCLLGKKKALKFQGKFDLSGEYVCGVSARTIV